MKSPLKFLGVFLVSVGAGTLGYWLLDGSPQESPTYFLRIILLQTIVAAVVMFFMFRIIKRKNAKQL